MDLVAVAIAKKYIEESLAGSGALKGAPCTIKSITPENGGNTITFEWTDSDGATQTDSMFVADGATGPQGDPGETGAKGDKGDKGDPGEKGDKGDIGPTGAQGIPGPQGAPGEKGATGATGADGFSPIIATNPNNTEDVYKLDIIDKNGSFTTPNLVGRQGDQGIQGERGETGPEGPQGIQGIQGIKGDKGEDGYPFLIYKEYTDISEFDASHFPEIGLMFMINNGDPDANRPVYRYTGETANPYSHVTDLTTSEGLKGEKGDKGDTGEQGIQGEAGINGEDGITFTPRIGTVQGVEAMQDAAATVEVDTENKLATYNFWIPRGPAGQQGLPGEKGEPGETGENGADGTTYTPAIGTVTHGSISEASVTVDIDEENKVANFNFVLPQGKDGVQFTPSINDENELEWSNDGELPNPPNMPLQQIYSSAPIGTVLSFAGNVAPNGYLVCNGQSVAVADYPDLYTVIGNTYGGDTENFNVPDYRETVLVGVGKNTTDTIASHDVYELGEFKDDQFQGHWHNLGNSNGTVTVALGASIRGSDTNSAASDPAIQRYKVDTALDAITDGTNGTPRVGTTTRGKQKGVTYIVKAKHTNEGTDVNVVLDDNVINHINNLLASELKTGSNVEPTDLVFSGDTAYFDFGAGNNKYEVKNGICYFQVYIRTNAQTTDTMLEIVRGLPKPKFMRNFNITPYVWTNNTYTPLWACIDQDGTLQACKGGAWYSYFINGSYPIA